MYNGQIIRKLLEERNILNKTLLESLGLPKNGGGALKQIIEGNPTVRKLEPIADFFQVSMDVFFDRKVPIISMSNHIIGNSNAIGNGNIISPDITSLEIENKNLKELIEEKNKRIDVLETLIKLLQEKK